MRGKKAEQLVLQKMIRYCDEITKILEKHHFCREDFENDIEFQFASGMCIIQIKSIHGQSKVTTSNYGINVILAKNEPEFLYGFFLESG